MLVARAVRLRAAGCNPVAPIYRLLRVSRIEIDYESEQGELSAIGVSFPLRRCPSRSPDVNSRTQSDVSAAVPSYRRRGTGCGGPSAVARPFAAVGVQRSAPARYVSRPAACNGAFRISPKQ